MKKRDRNIEIYNKRKNNHLTLESIANEYNISKERVRQIINSIDKSKVEKRLSIRLKNYYRKDGIQDCCSVRSINALIRYFNICNVTIEEFYDLFLDMDVNDFLRIRNIGKKSIEFLYEMQKDLRENKSIIDGCDSY